MQFPRFAEAAAHPLPLSPRSSGLGGGVIFSVIVSSAQSPVPWSSTRMVKVKVPVAVGVPENEIVSEVEAPNANPGGKLPPSTDQT
jgi:hypothetical protein